MTIRLFGDRAVLLEWPARMDEEIHQQVQEVYESLVAANWQEVISLVPAYASILVRFRKKVEHLDHLEESILSLPKISRQSSRTTHKIPVCYGGEFSPDLDELSQELGLSANEIIEQHCSQSYQVYMIGFLPGFPYLGPLPQALHCQRKADPRPRVPAGSVGLAGQQTGIYPMVSPGGWQLIGRTPVSLVNWQQAQPILMHLGDMVQFFPISPTDWDDWKSGNS